jgi:predicted dehydrogenase
MDALNYVLGEFDSLSANTHQHFDFQLIDANGRSRAVESTSPDSFTVQGTLKGGASASIHVATTEAGNPEAGTWIIYGEKGALKLEGYAMFAMGPSFTLSTFKGGAWEEIKLAPRNAVGEVYKAFAEDKKDGSVVTFEDAVVRQRMVEAIFKSAREGTRESYKTTF